LVYQIQWSLRFSQRCSWRYQPPGMWRHVYYCTGNSS
jgi:hypothetical protein